MLFDIALLEGCISSSGSSERLPEDGFSSRNMQACSSQDCQPSTSQNKPLTHILLNVLDSPATRNRIRDNRTVVKMKRSINQISTEQEDLQVQLLSPNGKVPPWNTGCVGEDSREVPIGVSTRD